MRQTSACPHANIPARFEINRTARLSVDAAGEKGPEISTDLLETRDHVASLANVSHVAGRDATVSCDVV